MKFQRLIPSDALSRNQLSLDDLDNAALVDFLNHGTGADSAEILERLDDLDVARILDLLPVKKQASIFGHLPLRRQAQLIDCMDCKTSRELFYALPDDEQADLLNLLTPERRNKLLGQMDSEQGAALKRLADYEEGSAGSLATSAFVGLRPYLTVSAAIDALRAAAPDSETIYVLYVLDDQGKLLGTISLRELILAAPEKTLGELMRVNPVTIGPNSTRREAADSIQRYDLLALPVVDEEGVMIGIITVDDAMDAAEIEDVSETARFGGSLNAVELDLRHSSLRRLFTARFSGSAC